MIRLDTTVTVIKQWHGALVRTFLVSIRDLKKMPTGGVPTWPYGVDMYQFRDRFVANEPSFRHCLQRLQDHTIGISRYLSINYVSKGVSVIPVISEEFTESSIGNRGQLISC
jgi:hypothetical protein